MTRLNIQHPITKQWRCFSTETDSWISEWLPEDKYKEWLIQEAAKQAAFELEQIGIRKPTFYIYNDAVYEAARMRYRDEHCGACTESECGNCKVWVYEDWFDYLHDAPEDFFQCKQDLIEGSDEGD